MADNFELYRQVVFLIGEGRVDWGADFAVITAYNSDGRPPANEQEGASEKQDDCAYPMAPGGCKDLPCAVS